MSRLMVVGQNMTEGFPNGMMRNADLVIGQEIDKHKIKEGFPPGFKHFFPKKDTHQSITWNAEKLHKLRTGYVQFHQSGQAEGWPFPSPARGMPFVKFQWNDTKLVVFSLWFLNSWFPVHADKHTDLRNQIVRHQCLPVVRSYVRRWQDNGWEIVGEGDTNSLKWEGELPDLKQIKRHGLDRAWISNGLRLLGPVTEGPKIGVGGQMQHNSVAFTVIDRAA